MMNKEDKIIWDDCVALWRRSSQAERVELEFTKLVPAFESFKSRISDFEKNAIQRDIKNIKRLTSDFEKNSINRDLDLVRRSVRKFLSYFKKSE